VDWFEYQEPFCAYVQDPILIDLSGNGFSLTDITGGVNFDFFGSGTMSRISWTKAGAQNGWLALDLNRDGKVNSGRELFGNAMPAPGPAWKRLGFKALAVYDTQAYGGNVDGVIDARDAMYSRLRIWVDANHNGITDGGELTSLNQNGVKAISLAYKDAHYTDAYGNHFRNRSQVVWQASKDNGRQHWAYDVVLLPGAPQGKH
jgi:hypothetical protein